MGRSAMAKELLSAAGIRAEINRRMAICEELDGDCRGCRVPLPRQAEVRDYGSNWHIDSAQNCVGDCLGVLDRVVADVRVKYDCSDW